MACHALILFALLTARVPAPVEVVPPVVTVSLVEAPAPAVAPASAAPASAEAAPAKSAPIKARTPRPSPAPDRLDAATRAATAGSGAGSGDLLSGAALGGAASADSVGGGECNMARRLQNALRRDALVRTAVSARGAPPGTAAILVWNGGWVASPGEDGRGLAAVREAIVWEVAFAPAACREGRVHGPVLFTVADASGLARIAIGAGDWRWGDLVSSR